jgi:hypothetical protein
MSSVTLRSRPQAGVSKGDGPGRSSFETRPPGALRMTVHCLCASSTNEHAADSHVAAIATIVAHAFPHARAVYDKLAGALR